MEVSEVKELMREFSNSSITFLKLSNEDFHIEMRKGENIKENPMEDEADNSKLEIKEDKPVVKVSVDNKDLKDLVTVKAPLVGTFYSAPSPKEAPFVKEGDQVKKGQVLCLMEAMKMINEIKSPVDGIVKKVSAENEALLSFNDVIMEIKEQ